MGRKTAKSPWVLTGVSLGARTPFPLISDVLSGYFRVIWPRFRPSLSISPKSFQQFFISGPKPNNSKRNVQTPKIGPRFWKSRPPRVFTREFCRDFGVSGVDFGVFRPNSSSSPIHPKIRAISRIFLQDFQFRHSNSEIFPPNTRAGLHAGGQKIKNPLAPRNKHRPSMACATSLESIPAI